MSISLCNQGGNSDAYGSKCEKMDCVLATTSLGLLHCVDMRSGSPLWAVNIGLGPLSSPTAIHQNDILGLEFDSRRQLRKRSSLACAGMFAVASNKGYISVLESPVCGPQRAETSPIPLGSLRMPGEIFSAPVFYEGALFFGCRDDRLYKVEYKT